MFLCKEEKNEERFLPGRWWLRRPLLSVFCPSLAAVLLFLTCYGKKALLRLSWSLALPCCLLLGRSSPEQTYMKRIGGGPDALVHHHGVAPRCPPKTSTVEMVLRISPLLCHRHFRWESRSPSLTPYSSRYRLGCR